MRLASINLTLKVVHALKLSILLFIWPENVFSMKSLLELKAEKLAVDKHISVVFNFR